MPRMQRLRSTFKRSRTPTGAEMKSQSSLEVPKQVRSASFDEIQLEAQRQEAELGLAAPAGRPPTAEPPVRKLATLRIPQLQTGQRSKSFDVAAAERSSLLEQRSSSAAGAPSSYYARWRGEAADSCWHCVCVERHRASLGAGDSAEDEDEGCRDADDEACEGPEPLQLEREDDGGCYFVVVQRACEEPPEEEGSDCSRREGSPEIRVTLTSTSERTPAIRLGAKLQTHST